MNEISRRRAFLASAMALTGAAALVLALELAADGDRHRPASRLRPLVADTARPERPAPRARITSPTHSLARARASARAFVRAFVRHQAGDTSPRVRVLLARTASTPMHRYLAAKPVRGSRQASSAEARSIRVYVLRRGEAKGSALLRYGRSDGLLEFQLERTRGGWRVTEVYP